MASVLGIDAAWTDGITPAELRSYAPIRTNGWKCVALAHPATMLSSQLPAMTISITMSDGTSVRKAGTRNQSACYGLQNNSSAGSESRSSRLICPYREYADRWAEGSRQSHLQKNSGGTDAVHILRVPLGRELSQTNYEKSLASLGYRLAVSEPDTCTVMEAYPHPALLRLLQRTYRVPYKVDRAR